MTPDELENILRPYMKYQKGSRTKKDGTISCDKIDHENYDWLLDLCDGWNVSFGGFIDAISLALQDDSEDTIPNLTQKKKILFDISWTGEQKSKYFEKLNDEECRIIGMDLESTLSFYNKEYKNR